MYVIIKEVARSFSTNNAINVVNYTIVLSSFLPFIEFLLSIYQCVIICIFILNMFADSLNLSVPNRQLNRSVADSLNFYCLFRISIGSRHLG